MKTEDIIADTLTEALDDLSDRNLEALRAAFDSGPINDPRLLIRYIYQEIDSQMRYRAGCGIE